MVGKKDGIAESSVVMYLGCLVQIRESILTQRHSRRTPDWDGNHQLDFFTCAGEPMRVLLHAMNTDLGIKVRRNLEPLTALEALQDLDAKFVTMQLFKTYLGPPVIQKLCALSLELHCQEPFPDSDLCHTGGLGAKKTHSKATVGEAATAWSDASFSE